MSSIELNNDRSLSITPQVAKQKNWKDGLPVELLHKIFSFLEPKDLQTARTVCKEWNIQVYNHLFNRELSIHRFFSKQLGRLINPSDYEKNPFFLTKNIFENLTTSGSSQKPPITVLQIIPYKNQLIKANYLYLSQLNLKDRSLINEFCEKSGKFKIYLKYNKLETRTRNLLNSCSIPLKDWFKELFICAQQYLNEGLTNKAIEILQKLTTLDSLPSKVPNLSFYKNEFIEFLIDFEDDEEISVTQLFTNILNSNNPNSKKIYQSVFDKLWTWVHEDDSDFDYADAMEVHLSYFVKIRPNLLLPIMRERLEGPRVNYYLHLIFDEIITIVGSMTDKTFQLNFIQMILEKISTSNYGLLVYEAEKLSNLQEKLH